MGQFDPNAVGSILVPKYQYFSASGWFYPTQALLDAGGVLDIDARGGGGGATHNAGNPINGNGGSSRHKTKYQVTSLAPIQVTIGSGGASSTSVSGTDGGSTSFGTLTVSGGKAASSNGGGTGYGNEGKAGATSFTGSNTGWTGAAQTFNGMNSGDQGTGEGGGWIGGTITAGRDGSVMVTWLEKAQ